MAATTQVRLLVWTFVAMVARIAGHHRRVVLAGRTSRDTMYTVWEACCRGGLQTGAGRPKPTGGQVCLQMGCHCGKLVPAPLRQQCSGCLRKFAWRSLCITRSCCSVAAFGKSCQQGPRSKRTWDHALDRDVFLWRFLYNVHVQTRQGNIAA